MSETYQPRHRLGAFAVDRPTLFLSLPAEPIKFETLRGLCDRIALLLGDRRVGLRAIVGSFRGSATFSGFYLQGYRPGRDEEPWQAAAFAGDGVSEQAFLDALQIARLEIAVTRPTP
jgi:hypothetical protein